jgi:hypothetical protein
VTRIIVVAVVAAAAVATTIAAAVLTGGPDPALRVSSEAPMTVEGRGFGAQEAVTVTLKAGPDTYHRRVTADAEGAFRATLQGVPVDPCGGLAVTAIGAEGSRASAKLPQRLCPP